LMAGTHPSPPCGFSFRFTPLVATITPHPHTYCNRLHPRREAVAPLTGDDLFTIILLLVTNLRTHTILEQVLTLNTDYSSGGRGPSHR